MPHPANVHTSRHRNLLGCSAGVLNLRLDQPVELIVSRSLLDRRQQPINLSRERNRVQHRVRSSLNALLGEHLAHRALSSHRLRDLMGRHNAYDSRRATRTRLPGLPYSTRRNGRRKGAVPTR